MAIEKPIESTSMIDGAATLDEGRHIVDLSAHGLIKHDDVFHVWWFYRVPVYGSDSPYLPYFEWSIGRLVSVAALHQPHVASRFHDQATNTDAMLHARLGYDQHFHGYRSFTV
jgi:hypothetical protein